MRRMTSMRVELLAASTVVSPDRFAPRCEAVLGRTFKKDILCTIRMGHVLLRGRGSQLGLLVPNMSQ